MTMRQVVKYVLSCNGCGDEIGEEVGGYASALEGRAAAYGAGWRFLPKVRANGQPGKQTSDVCPKCLTTRENEESMNAWKGLTPEQRAERVDHNRKMRRSNT